MKLAIVTLQGDFNFGNRLQNYALQQILEQLGHSADSLVFQERSVKTLLRPYLERRNGIPLPKPLPVIRRESRIRRFSDKYIHRKTILPGSREDRLLADSYDRFLCGSDQVWNPLFWEEDPQSPDFQAFLLRFAPPEKRLAYAASFGIPQLPDFWRPLIAGELKKFSAISLRETAGAELLRELTGRSAETVLDPTMLLTADQWKQSLGLREEKGDYVLSFFLGQPAEPAQARIRALKEQGIEVLELMDPHSRVFVSGPEDFLRLILNARAVLTDSFHAAVFSILFQVSFLVFDRHHANRGNMNSRITTLLAASGLSQRYFQGQEISLFHCDFTGVSQRIDALRERSLQYLEEALL